NNPPINRKFSIGRRNFPTVNRKFPTASRKFTIGSTKFHTADMGKKGKVVKPLACWTWNHSQKLSNKGSSQNNIDDKGYWDSGCSRHMTGNISYLSDFEPFDGGYVSFGQGGCGITGKGTIKTECIVLGRNFKLLDDANILLRTPRQHNMYSINLNNIVPHKDLTCLVAKASADECILWHRRLGKVKFLIVAMDYFTKWIEAKAVATITGNQSNGLVERANRSLREGIKARLGEENKNWVEELPHVLWAHRTMIKSSHGDTPFSLTYGTEAVIPAEIGMPTYRTAAVDVVHNNEELRLNLDMLEERRERAAIREAKAKLKMTKYYNARIRGVTFRPGDFVYLSNDVSHAVDGGKLGPKWEGPYEVTEALGNRAYKLRSMDGTVIPRTWNIANLKKCYL
nr:reverse transcriptase domain-containing protein [Tanacetum cinerariifolium]